METTKPTASKCPTRTALERKPGDPGFLADSIHARHTEKNRQQRAANLMARQNGGRKK